ncbi:MAG: hypothetical protein A2Y84_02285 [Candidatus Colwellbacteria bacterium RBG_13_48_8]|uniref:Adenylate kinase n=1 Tax=Candidatus Colwellbacteria bacterium RBG_13_48_8 TaxID=1797685 RepID=A0A1G1YXI7_9BACT|nr:MAG: hypothetical protein A2Y84_02285 [Candidatus Colwellbacteria bacterium RBG_13_48_8]
MPKIIFISGPPGSGKNTQAKFLSKEFGFPHFDTGDMIRDRLASGEIKDGTLLEEGFLMPREQVLQLSQEKISEMLKADARGLIISGIPRSSDQAFGTIGVKGVVDWLSEKLGKQELIFIHINLPEEESIKRNMARGEGRVDDQPEVLETRLLTYKQETAPLLEELRKRGFNVIEIDGLPSREEVFADIKRHLDK